MKRLTYLLVSALAGIAIASCGGGGSGSSTVAEGGIGGTGISSGSISAFSSIVVNGKKFDVEAAGITVNSNPNATQGDLDIGYVVRVDGDLDNGVAEEVRFEAELIGEVDANAIPSGEAVGTLTVMQQTVEITATTVLEGIDSPDTITPSDRVLVSGFRDSSDRLVATHIELNPMEPTDQIVGRVDSSSASTFEINGLVIKSNTTPDQGDLLLVRGDYDTASQEFTPSFPIEELESLVRADTEIELEGIVDSFFDVSNFTVGGIRVDAGDAVIEDETGAPATFEANAEVEVEGTFDTDGTLVADRVEVELEDNVEITARVANDPGFGGPVQFFNASGDLQLSVEVTAKTRLRDKTDPGIENFSVADLATGDWVELDGFENVDGDVTALKIERFDPDADEKVVVEGFVDSKDAAKEVVTVLGMSFKTTGTGFDLGSIDAGDTVEVEWDPGTPFVQPDMPIEDIEQED